MYWLTLESQPGIQGERTLQERRGNPETLQNGVGWEALVRIKGYLGDLALKKKSTGSTLFSS